METLNEFLESSSIHGLFYIRGAKSPLARMIWILIVLAGFSAAGKVIYDSFQAWDESPVVSSVRTKPITQMKFPQVTVCPPQNSNTALNQDFAALESELLEDETRASMKRLFIDTLYKEAHEQYIERGMFLLQKNLKYYMSGDMAFNIPIYASRGKSVNMEEYICGINGSIESPIMSELKKVNISTLIYLSRIELPSKKEFENISSISYLKCDVFSETNGRTTFHIRPPKWSEKIEHKEKCPQIDNLTFDYRN